MLERDRGVVWRFFRHRVARQRHRHAAADEPGSLTALRWRYQIQCAELVIRAPASPIGRLFHPAVDVFVLFVGGAPAGFFELDRSEEDEVEVVQVGLVPEFQGRGLGKYVVATAVETAWDDEPARVWASTDADDDPRGLLLYQWAGFTAYETLRED